MSSGVVEKVRDIAHEVTLREGCLLYDLEFLEAGSRVLRVYIDRDPGGASLDDCVNVSRGLNLALDVADVIPGGHYDLEVSTPGLERKLTQEWHFQRAIGESVRIKYEAEDMNKTVTGKITAVENGKLTLEEGKKAHEIPLDKVLKAKMVFGGVDKKGPKGKPQKKTPIKKR